MHVAILTSPNQWFEPYAIRLSKRLGGVPVYMDHQAINNPYTVLFILSYHRIIDQSLLDQNNHNIVIHESDLPTGKGWAPLFWQILEGQNSITFSMFEALKGVDAGPIYMQRTLDLTGYELNPEIRMKQAELLIDMCVDFLENMDQYLPPREQIGDETFYPKRTPKDSQLDPQKSLEEQFNLLRIASNEEYPAFFEIGSHRYLIKIEEKKD